MIRLANAPCSWGVLEFDSTAEPMAFDAVLDEMAEAGYAGTELGDLGFMPTDPAALRDAIAARGLALLGAFVPVALRDPAAHGPGVAAALTTARLLAGAGASEAFVVLADDNGAVPERARSAGRITPDLGLDDAQWTTFARGAETLARIVHEETGLSTVFHHHGAGYVETPAEVAALLARTDPALVGLCLDTGHWAFGGGDPVGAVREHGDRIRHVHFKDHDRSVTAYEDYLDAVRRGVFCELGRGAVDFAGVFSALSEVGYDGWIVVEQDVLPGMGTPFESAVRNRHFLGGLGL